MMRLNEMLLLLVRTGKVLDIKSILRTLLT